MNDEHVDNRPLLILDLDETLIYASKQPLAIEHDFICGVYRIHKRPFVGEFIAACSQRYDLAVWTSSTMSYARDIVAALFGGVPLSFLWARERCTRRLDLEMHEPYWLKDLKKVKRAGFDLDRVLMVDDTPKKLERNFGNIVVVNEYTGDPADRELPALADYLAGISDQENFRKFDKRDWRRSAD